MVEAWRGCHVNVTHTKLWGKYRCNWYAACWFCLGKPGGIQGRKHEKHTHSDDAATVKIDAARNRIHVQFYENEAQLRWLSFKDKTATQVRGDLYTVTRYEGDDVDTRFNAPAQMELQNNGRQILSKNVLQKNTTRVLVYCGP